MIHRSSSMICAVLIVAAFCGLPALAEDRTYETPAGLIVIDIDTHWRSMQPDAEGISGIAFETGNVGRSMNFILGTVDELSDETFDAADVHKLVSLMRDDETKDGKTATEVRELRGSRVAGAYFEATAAPNARPKVGEYRWMIAGVIVTRTTPLVFTIAWNDAQGKAAADRAFAAVRGLRFADR